MARIALPRSRALSMAGMLLALAGAPACGGGGGGDGNPTGSMSLINFDQAGIQNSALNQVLRFVFSEAVDPQSLNASSLQVREGPQFGATVAGKFRISGAALYFEPALPGLCDLSDAGFKADTQYRVTLVGFPESFALRRDDGNPGSATGDPLKGTLNFEFHTRLGDDPLLFTDQIAATPPVVTSTSPVDGTAAVQVVQGNQVVVDISENLLPCSVDNGTVLFDEYERGDLNVFAVDPVSGRQTGFSPAADADPVDRFTWGPVTGGESSISPPQRIRATIGLVQSFVGTRITITPEYGQFPENALCVVQLTFGIRDFGGNALVPYVFAFTTENLPVQNGTYELRFEGETPILKDQSTADVNTIRSPLVAQGWLLFSGDADNGPNLFAPTLPANNPALCNIPRQVNDGVKDDFDVTTADVLLDTGASINLCPNTTDGSTAVVWEFRTFRIRSGRTVRMRGVNPAIILVQGDVTIENGAKLMVKGDGAGGSPQPNGSQTSTPTAVNPGGVAAVGGGDGGRGYGPWSTPVKGDNGVTGYGSPSGQGVVGGPGAGVGGSQAIFTNFAAQGSGYGGGGGGHSQVGMDGQQGMNATMTYMSSVIPTGGGAYPAGPGQRMLLPEAGCGGGAGGHSNYNGSQQAGNTYCGGGGSGGAGGGFCDLTSSGNIRIFGILDASGGRGGSGGTGFYSSGGGGGGGSGGGIRLLTPNAIDLNGGTLTTAGGTGGACPATTGASQGPWNTGGAGGKGRICLEDGDSLITGIGSATLVPGEGDVDGGFYRGVFDANRFQSGGLEPQLLTDIFLVGPNNPTFAIPVQADFLASIPTGSDRGLNGTACLIEARGFQIMFDGTVDTVTGPSPWKTVGFLKHSGVSSLPTWVANLDPGDVTMPAGNTGPGITALNGNEFMQLRITFFLPSSMGPFDPGPILDNWTIRFSADQ